MFYNMWNLPDCFRLPVKACRPQPQLRLLDRLFTVQGLVTNHAQGRVNLLSLPKNVPADSSSVIAPNRNLFKQNVWKFFGDGNNAGREACGRFAFLDWNDFQAFWLLSCAGHEKKPRPCRV